MLPLELNNAERERRERPKSKHLISTAVREPSTEPNLERFPLPSRLDVLLLGIMMEKRKRSLPEDAARRAYNSHRCGHSERLLFLETWAQEARDEGTR